MTVDALRAACLALVNGDPEPLVALMDDGMEWRGRRPLRPWKKPPS